MGSSHFLTFIFHRVIKYERQFSDTVARPRKRPRRCLTTDFSPAAWFRIQIFKHDPSANEGDLARGVGGGGGGRQVDGLIPLIRRCCLKSFVSHKQTSWREKLPPPTYPAATLQLFLNQSEIKSAALFMHPFEAIFYVGYSRSVC